MRAGLVLAAGFLLVAAACDRVDRPGGEPGSAQAATFTHDLPEDVSGYFIPATDVRAGDWRLHHLFLGPVPDFIAWEGGQRTAGFAPVMIEFEDMAGAPVATETGPQRRRIRLIPTAYAVTEDRVRMQATSRELGVVSFEGRLDQDALAQARRNLGDRGAVVKGRLTVGDRSFDGLSLRWWAGD